MYVVEHVGADAARALGWCADACCDAWAVYAAPCAADYAAGYAGAAVLCNRTAAADYAVAALRRAAGHFFGETDFLG